MKGLLLVGALIVPTMPLAAQELEKTGTQKVVGIGGLFFRAKDPAALGRWYEKHLGIAPVPSSYEQEPWRQEAGPTVFAPFPDTTGHFGKRDRRWMVNFRVRDLTAMVAQLQTSGIAVKLDPKLYPNGRFARLHDPEGNPIELWEPADPAQSRKPE